MLNNTKSCGKGRWSPKKLVVNSKQTTRGRHTSNDIQGADDEVPLGLRIDWLPRCSGHAARQLLRDNADAPVKHGLGKLLKGVTCANKHSRG